jgi:N-acetylmuramoyl-L-alanine amidase
LIELIRLSEVPCLVRRESPNHTQRPDSVKAIECVVLHATADQGHEISAELWLCSPVSRVSAHLHVRRNGTSVRLVPDSRRAWHAGVSEWNGRVDVNDFSLGWEIANRNDGKESYTDAQYQTLARLGAHYVSQGLPLSAFVSHASVARPVGRKTDPRGFDWKRFSLAVNDLLSIAC